MNKDVIILREVVRKLVPLLSGKGIRVTQFGARAYVKSGPSGKPEVVNIPNIPDNADAAFICAIQGFIDHEVGHVLFTDWAEIRKGVSEGLKIAQERGWKKEEEAKRLAVLHNIVEDPFVERSMQGKFPGAAWNLDKLYEIFLSRITKPELAKHKGNVPNEFSILMVPLVRAWAGQKKFHEFLSVNGYYDHPAVKAFTDSVPQELRDACAKAKSSADTLAIARKFYDILYPPPPPPMSSPSMSDAINEEMKDQEQSSGASQSDEKSDEKQDGEGSNQNKPEDDEDKGSGGEEGEDDSEQPESKEGEGAAEGKDKSDEGEKDDAEEPADGEQPSPGADDNADDADDADDGAGKDGDDQPDAGDDEADDGSASGGGDDEKDEDGDAGEEEGSAGEKDDDDETEGSGDRSDDDAEQDKDGGSGSDGDEPDGDTEADAGEDDGAADKPGEDSEDVRGDGDDEEGDAEGQADGEEEASDKPGDEEGEDEDELSGSGGDGDSEKDEGAEATDEKPTRHGPGFSELVPEEELDMSDRDLSAAMSKEITDQATRETRNAEYRIFTKDWDKIEVYEPQSVPDNGIAELDDQTRHMIAPMQKELERMMAARSQIVNTGGFRSGRLHGGALHRLKFNDDRVFRRRQENKTKETAVSLVIDNSGSMRSYNFSGEFHIAMAAGYALCQTLDRLKIRNEVSGFTTAPLDNRKYNMINEEAARIGRDFTRAEPLYIPIYKTFEERLGTDVRRRFAGAIANQNMIVRNNVDGESVRYAAQRLLMQKEPRKVMLVLSDGHPACSTPYRDEVYADLHRAVKECEDAHIEIVGIGIGSDAVETFYPKHIVLSDLQTLPPLIMQELKRILLNPQKAA